MPYIRQILIIESDLFCQLNLNYAIKLVENRIQNFMDWWTLSKVLQSFRSFPRFEQPKLKLGTVNNKSS